MLSWNEIRTRALQFSREWEGETREMAEYQSFWDDFFTCSESNVDPSLFIRKS